MVYLVIHRVLSFVWINAHLIFKYVYGLIINIKLVKPDQSSAVEKLDWNHLNKSRAELVRIWKPKH